MGIMQKNLPLRQNGAPLLFLIALTGITLLAGATAFVCAETVVTETTITTTGLSTSSEIAAQELDLKAKLLEYEKAKLDLQKSEALDLRKAQLENDIKKLELLKARRDLMVKETQLQLDMQVRRCHV